MLAVRGGHLEVMGVLFARHSPRMYRFFRRRIADRGACEDLVQTLFVRMLEYRASYEGRARFVTWMYRIALRLRSDHLRRQRRRVDHPGGEWLEEVVAAPESGISQRERSRLRAAMNRLRPEELEVLMLTRFEELSYDEVAELLGCTVGALKVRVHRALRELRKKYAEAGATPWP